MKGFTLVEIVIVIAIFLILTALLITPFVLLNKEQSLTGSALIIKATLSEAGSRTISSDGEKQYGITFTEGEDSIILFSSTGSETEVSLNSYVTISDVSLTSGGDVTFDRLTGEIDNPGTITITNGEATKVITIYATGVVE
ncbi:MAG: type II secretion system GspH family protein [Candidatus Pacebacteria bacterium]|nr:type II secretion system GspH family protein [Candidatus Paceibacterota bacterium]